MAADAVEIVCRIVIAGGGIGGMALARALAGDCLLHVTVVERDASFDARAQGYGLTMQQGSVALRDLDIYDQVVREDTPSSSHYVFTSDGRIIGAFGRVFASLYEKDTEARDEAPPAPVVARLKVTKKEFTRRYNVHLPRQRLRELLMAGVPPSSVVWGRFVTGYTLPAGDAPAGAPIRVHLDDGTDLVADVLVGADGFHSAVRTQLWGGRAHSAKTYLGVLVVLGMAPCSHPLVHERVWQMVDGDTRLFAMPFTIGAHPTTFWQLSFPVAEADALAICRDAQVLAHEVLRRCGAWHAPLPELLHNTPHGAITAYPVYDRDPLPVPPTPVPSPTPPRRPHKHHPRPETGDPGAPRGPPSASRDPIAPPAPRCAAPAACLHARGCAPVTILGDAAHTMSPFKGQGANQALLDALSLAKQLQRAARQAVKRGDHAVLPANICRALAHFEAEMLSRTRAKVLGSRAAAIRLHRPEVLEAAEDAESARRLPQAAIEALAAANIGAWTGPDLDTQVLAVLRGQLIADEQGT